MLFGSCASIEEAAALAEAGFDYFEGTVGPALMPDKSDAEWEKTRDAILSAPIPMRSCACFIPGSFRLTGPEADHAPALDYAEVACRRADAVGCRCIVFGSGGARNVPGDFCGPNHPDLERGRDQYTEFCAALAKRIADCAVTVVIEPLCPNESNIVNFVWQAVQISNEIGSPRIQVLADFYHMLRGKETADSIIAAGGLLKHCHVAQSPTRAYPGHDDIAELAPYFKALKSIGYEGGVSCECSWPLREGATIQDARREAVAAMKKLAL